jgi:hypothetical protein
MGNQYGPVTPWTTRVRKDPLGAVGWDSLTQLFRFTEQQNLGVEHIIGSGSHAGEHNAPNIPRDVGNIHSNAIGVKVYSSLGSHPATGEYRLTFSGYSWSTLWDFPSISLQVAAMSEDGNNKPCLVVANPVANNDFRFYPWKLSSALGAGNAWVAQDADFAWCIHGTPRPIGTPEVLAPLKMKGETLDDVTVNDLITAEANLFAKFGQYHSQTDGHHQALVVPKAWAYLGWNGSTSYSAVDHDPSNPTTVITRVGQGHVQVSFTTAWSLPTLPFFSADFPRKSGGSPGKPYVICTPYSAQTSSRVELYIYSYDGTNWGRDDTDFFLTVYGA